MAHTEKANGSRLRAGMTLIELMLAMLIIAMVLAGVSTLAFALSSVKSASDDTSTKQAYVRYAQTQLADLIRHARLVAYASSSEVVLWSSDTNEDRQMNVNEMAIISINATGGSISMSRFSSVGNPAVSIASVGDMAGKWWLGYGATVTTTTIVPACTGAAFYTDAAAPLARYVSFTFNLAQDGETITYGVSGYLRGWGGNTLGAGNSIVSDDD